MKVQEIDPITKQTFYKAGNDMLFKSVFSDEKNRDLLEKILEVTTGKKVKIIGLPLMQDIAKTKINIRSKTLDVLVKDENDDIYNIEINMSHYTFLPRRNASFIFSKYAEDIKVQENYKNMHNFIQINLTSRLSKDYPEVCKYKMIDKVSGKEYIDNLTIYEYNLDKILKVCYNGDKEEYKILAALVCNKEELHTICKGDILLEKLESEVIRMNSDEEFIGLMSPEREAEVFKNSLVSEAKEEGMAEGIKLGTIQGTIEGAKSKQVEIARKMLADDVDIDSIVKFTDLTREEIEGLK